MKNCLLKILKFYKRYISSGYNCRFTPTCSEYMYQAVEKYGVLKGVRLGIIRVSKCHPWGKSGIDLLE